MDQPIVVFESNEEAAAWQHFTINGYANRKDENLGAVVADADTYIRALRQRLPKILTRNPVPGKGPING